MSYIIITWDKVQAFELLIQIIWNQATTGFYHCCFSHLGQ